MMPVEMIENADVLKVLDGFDVVGNLNTSDDQILRNIEHSIRLGYPQYRPLDRTMVPRVCIVGGGPSLESTLPELRELYFSGAFIVTVNGAYQWCIERNIRPSAQIVLDARPENARFVQPAVPKCLYLIASQCAPETWAQVEGRPDVWIWHAVNDANSAVRPVLDRYYGDRWYPTPGGTTVVMRAITLLQGLGYFKFDLFGVDSCYMDGKGHAYHQPENEADKAFAFDVSPSGHPELKRTFLCAPWHAKQLECFLQLIRLNGDQFVLKVHGGGMLAYALEVSAKANVVCAAATDGSEE